MDHAEQIARELADAGLIDPKDAQFTTRKPTDNQLFRVGEAANGYIVESRDASMLAVFEAGEYDENGEVDCFVNLLRFILEQHGPSTSRYSAKRIYIEVRPGDKYEPSASEDKSRAKGSRRSSTGRAPHCKRADPRSTRGGGLSTDNRRTPERNRRRGKP